MRRLLPLFLLVAALAPASASAEPVGSPYRFSGDGPLTGLSMASAVNGYVLASWADTSGSSYATTMTRVLGRSGPLDGPRAIDEGANRGPSALAANPRLGQYLRAWGEYEEDYWSNLRTQTLTSNGTVAAPHTTLQRIGESAMYAQEAVYNQRTRQYLLVENYGDESGVFAEAFLLDEQGQFVRRVQCCGGWDAGRPDVDVRRDGSYLTVVSEREYSEAPGSRDSISGQWITAGGERAGTSFVISGTVADPRVAMNSDTGEALVVWSDGSEVIARRIGTDGRPRGGELTLSQMGPPSDPEWQTGTPDVAYNSEAKQFLVVWPSGPRREPYPIGEHVYGQHLDGAGRQIGANDFRISEGDRAQAPRVSAVRSSKDWLVGWGDPTGVARQVTATTGSRPPADVDARPPAPTGLRASVDGQTVRLSWNASTERDFAYFAVRRDTQPVVTTSSWTRLPDSFTSSNATDAPGPGRFWYYVNQVDRSGQISPKSATVRVDVAVPPAPPVVDPAPAPPVAQPLPPPATGTGVQTPAGPTPAPPTAPGGASAAPGSPTAPVIIVQGSTPVVAAPASAPGQRAISAAQALRQARTALRLVYKTAFSKGRRFKATCRRSAATRRTCTVSWRYKRFSYKGRVVVRLSRNAYSTTVSVKRTRLR